MCCLLALRTADVVLSTLCTQIFVKQHHHNLLPILPVLLGCNRPPALLLVLLLSTPRCAGFTDL